jgi:hypothetical protein
MKKTYIALLAVLVTAFFMPKVLLAESNLANPAPIVCDPVDKEDVLLKGLQDSPELLVAVLQGKELGAFWDNMAKAGMAGGPPLYNKIYIFKSEKHPDSVYVFFLTNGCISNVQMTYKALIDKFLDF